MADISRILSRDSDKERAALRNELRTMAKHERAQMPGPYRAHKSSELCKRLNEALELTLAITNIDPDQSYIGVYSAFPEEVDLDDFITFAYGKGCHMVFPCMVRDAWSADEGNIPQQTMEMREVSADAYRSKQVAFLNHPLKRYCHNSEELEENPYCNAAQLTMLVVPVVGFDAQGNRLGYGAGNYDRYLTQVPSSCRVVGVAFAEQQVDPIPTEPHDVPLTIVSL